MPRSTAPVRTRVVLVLLGLPCLYLVFATRSCNGVTPDVHALDPVATTPLKVILSKRNEYENKFVQIEGAATNVDRHFAMSMMSMSQAVVVADGGSTIRAVVPMRTSVDVGDRLRLVGKFRTRRIEEGFLLGRDEVEAMEFPGAVVIVAHPVTPAQAVFGALVCSGPRGGAKRSA
jgi:hypothetical protein